MTKQKQYIDRNALLRQAETLFDGQREVMGVKAEHIYSAPLEDVAEVVRCKNCRHYGLYGVCKLHSEDADRYSAGAEVKMESNDYCSYGERR